MHWRDDAAEIGALPMGLLGHGTVIAFTFEDGQATGYAIATESGQSLGQTIVGVRYGKL